MSLAAPDPPGAILHADGEGSPARERTLSSVTCLHVEEVLFIFVPLPLLSLVWSQSKLDIFIHWLTANLIP